MVTKLTCWCRITLGSLAPRGSSEVGENTRAAPQLCRARTSAAPTHLHRRPRLGLTLGCPQPNIPLLQVSLQPLPIPPPKPSSH